MGMLEDDLTQFPPHERKVHFYWDQHGARMPSHERKVHFYWDQHGARMPSHVPGVQGKPFANTLCKMNSTSPDMRTTMDPLEVTCKICLKDRRMQVALANTRPAPAPEIIRVVRVLEYWGPRDSVEKVLQQNAVKGFKNFGSVTIREAMLPFPEVLDRVDGR